MEEKKNVLLITYYWPPSGGAGVHRWLRFSKYFNPNGVQLTVYCPSDAAWPSIDKELISQVPEEVKVIQTKIFEPQKFLGKSSHKGTGFTQTKESGPLQKMIVWIRGNLFIPDSRVFWIKPSVKFLSKYLSEHPEIDTIISTGPPHSTHIIALTLKKKLGLKWLADFRDPWTQIDFYEDLLPGKRADAKHKKLEKLCLENADEVITVSEACATGLEEIGKRKVNVITNGFTFPTYDKTTVELDSEFTIAHLGSMPNARNPIVLWKALSELVQENELIKMHLKVKLIGSVDYQILETAKEYGLQNYVEVLDSVLHSESIQLQRQAQLLLLVANTSGNVKGILTGKFFEYLGAKRPIIAIGEENSDLESAMKNTQAGYFSNFNDKDGLKQYLLNCVEHYIQKDLLNEPVNLNQYSSEHLAKKIIALI